MRGSLISENIWHNPAFSQLRNNVGAVSNQPDRNIFLFSNRILQNSHGLIERGDHEVAIPGLQTFLDAFSIDINSQECCTSHSRRQWLSASHASHAPTDN